MPAYPHQTVRALLTHTAFRCSSRQGMRPLPASRCRNLTYNLIRLIIAQSALMADVLPRAPSFKHTLQLWLAWSGSSAQTDDGDKVMQLPALVAGQAIGKRPGRIECCVPCHYIPVRSWPLFRVRSSGRYCRRNRGSGGIYLASG